MSEGGSCGRFLSEINSLSVTPYFRRTTKGFMHRAILLYKMMRLSSLNPLQDPALPWKLPYYTHRLASIVMNIARDERVSPRDCMIIMIKAAA